MLDLKDKRILAALDKNSRSSFSELSKATGMPQETVRYRFGKLVETGVIQHFPTFINGPKLGYIFFEMLFKLHNVSRKRYEEILDFFCKQERVGWVAELEGNYDIAIIICAKHQLELQKVIDRLYAKYSDCILHKQLSINLRGELFAREWLLNEERIISPHVPIYIYETTIELKPYERELVRLLSLDARIPVVELAQKTGVTVETIVQAMKRLRKDNVILGESLVLRLDLLGVSHYKILLTLNNVTEKDTAALHAFARGRKRVLGMFRSLADYDYQIDVEVSSIQELKEITMELNTNFSHIIHDYEVLRIANMPKYTFFP